MKLTVLFSILPVLMPLVSARGKLQLLRESGAVSIDSGEKVVMGQGSGLSTGTKDIPQAQIEIGDYPKELDGDGTAPPKPFTIKLGNDPAFVSLHSNQSRIMLEADRLRG